MDIIYYLFLFITLYIQVFFLVSYLEDPDFYDRKGEDLQRDPELPFYPKVTLIVACWNEEDTLDQTMDSLLALNYPREQLQIILVDDGSKDKTWEKMQNYQSYEQVLLLHKENGGKFTAINYALPYAQGDFIATVDADTLLERNALRFILKEFVKNPELSAVGATILIREPKTLVQYAQSIEYQMFSFTKLVLARMYAALVIPGAFSVYRREVFEKIGAFRMAHLLEDLELTFRMQEAGLRVGQSRDAFAYTKGPQSIFALFKQRLRWSYGFLMNSYDYRKMLRGKENFHFGIFTLPMSIFSYLSIPIVFFASWFFFLRALVRFIEKIHLLGWRRVFTIRHISFDFSHLGTLFILSLFIYTIVFFMIYTGKRIARAERKNPLEILLFFLVYATLVPFWVLKSFYKIIFAKKVSWR